MEDVWKELSLSSLHHPSSSSSAASAVADTSDQPPISALDFQDFLSGPSNQVQRSQSDGPKSSTGSKTQTKIRANFGSSNDEDVYDRKRIRLMKNRESAARSRARKQAYTYELELEVAHLLEENARLKQQQQEKLCAAAGDQRTKKHKLYRTLTAPF